MYKDKEWLGKQLLIKTQKQIAKDCSVHVSTIETWINRHNLQKHKIKCLYQGNVEKMTVNNPYFCYLLGLFVTDGYFHLTNNVIDITNNSRQPLQLLADHFDLKLYHYNNHYRLTFSTIFSTVFISLGFIPGAKTFNCPSPIIPECNKKYYIRGMIDGDGTIRKNNLEIRFFSCSKHLIKAFTNYCDSHDWNYNVYKQKSGEIVTLLQNNGLQPALEIYKDIPELCIPYKKQIIQKKVNDIVRTYEMINRKKWVLNESMIT